MSKHVAPTLPPSAMDSALDGLCRQDTSPDTHVRYLHQCSQRALRLAAEYICEYAVPEGLPPAMVMTTIRDGELLDFIRYDWMDVWVALAATYDELRIKQDLLREVA